MFLLAVQFLTRWPIRSQDLFTEARLTAATRYYPLVGALVGAFSGAVFWLAHLVFPVSLAVVLATGAAAVFVLLAVTTPATILAGLGGLAAGHLVMRLLYERKLGGYTGDCLGAVQQTGELGMYLGVAAAM